MSDNVPKVLVVCDELETRLFLSNFLRGEGYRVLDAEDDTDGVQLAQAERPALIIIDMMMPREGGIQMYRFLKGHKQLRETPVIMLSALDQAHCFRYWRIQGDASAHGLLRPNAYLEKPLESDELLSLVQTLTQPGSRNPGKTDEMEA